MQAQKLKLMHPPAGVKTYAIIDGETYTTIARVEDVDTARKLVHSYNRHDALVAALEALELRCVQARIASNIGQPRLKDADFLRNECDQIARAARAAITSATIKTEEPPTQEDSQRTFSILIAYPDQGTWFGTAHGDTVEEAIEDARRQINEDNGTQYTDDELEVLAVIAGEHQDLKP